MGLLRWRNGVFLLHLSLGIFLYSLEAKTNADSDLTDWDYPWEDCIEMGQIVGRKCETLYYVCDFGDQWFVREVLCGNCVGDCPPSRVFDNYTETCVWPNTIGCDCQVVGDKLGALCDDKFYECYLLANNDWATTEILCEAGSKYDPQAGSCQPEETLECQ